MSLADALKAAASGAGLPAGFAAADAIRRYRGSDNALATAAGVSRSSVARAKIKKAIDRETAKKLARVLCVPVSAFHLRKERGR